MSLPVFRRFSIQDIPDPPRWLPNLLTPLNLFCEGTVTAFTKNLVIGQNVQGQKFSTSFSTPSNYSSGGFNPLLFQYSGGGQPTCLLIGAISREDGAALLNPITITDWFANINRSPIQVTVNYIAGLSTSTNYNIVLVAL